MTDEEKSLIISVLYDIIEDVDSQVYDLAKGNSNLYKMSYVEKVSLEHVKRLLLKKIDTIRQEST